MSQKRRVAVRLAKSVAQKAVVKKGDVRSKKGVLYRLATASNKEWQE